VVVMVMMVVMAPIVMVVMVVVPDPEANDGTMVPMMMVVMMVMVLCKLNGGLRGIRALSVISPQHFDRIGDRFKQVGIAICLRNGWGRSSHGLCSA